MWMVVGRIAEQMIDIAALIKRIAIKVIYTPPIVMVDSIFADYRCALQSFGFSRRYFPALAHRRRPRRQSIHDQVDPEDLRNGERFIDADKRCYEVYRYG